MGTAVKIRVPKTDTLFWYFSDFFSFFLPDLKCSNFCSWHFFGPILSLKTCLEPKFAISEILKNFEKNFKIENHRLKKNKKNTRKKIRKKVEIGPSWSSKKKYFPKIWDFFFRSKCSKKLKKHVFWCFWANIDFAEKLTEVTFFFFFLTLFDPFFHEKLPIFAEIYHFLKFFKNVGGHNFFSTQFFLPNFSLKT